MCQPAWWLASFIVPACVGENGRFLDPLTSSVTCHCVLSLLSSSPIILWPLVQTWPLQSCVSWLRDKGPVIYVFPSPQPGSYNNGVCYSLSTSADTWYLQQCCSLQFAYLCWHLVATTVLFVTVCLPLLKPGSYNSAFITVCLPLLTPGSYNSAVHYSLPTLLQQCCSLQFAYLCWHLVPTTVLFITVCLHLLTPGTYNSAVHYSLRTSADTC